ncbi:MAG: hypothetical protein KAJ14_07445 [Candidatus Omnitrophica bacterium]|nr:hypothetical protein [Candidatus Omnitrophota bacterium]
MNNPVWAKIVKNAWKYKRSSAFDHVGERGSIKLDNYKVIESKEWRDYLKENDLEMAEEIRVKTNRGLVVGTDRFIKGLEKRLNRSLKCLCQGRSKKEGR